MAEHPLIENILTFWFSSAKSKTYGQFQPMWFKSTPQIDQAIKLRYEKILEEAKKGRFDDLQKTPEGMLTLILLFDQFPRNMYRNSSKAYETDEKARSLAQKALDLGFDQKLPEFMRPFVYLPFEHSENLKDQEKSIALFESLGNQHFLDYALNHYDIIRRFGRFPFRNKYLKRVNTEEENAFLKENKMM
ncbi:MAG: DUF924 domain-containing protein [Proteobacteria bacterium]|nr:DUF924 domain-containing protein [Pseudomonadota bacterium]